MIIAYITRILALLVSPRAAALFTALIPILLALQTFFGLSAAVSVQPEYVTSQNRLKGKGWPSWAFYAGPYAWLVAQFTTLMAAFGFELQVYSRRVLRQVLYDTQETRLSPPELVASAVQSVQPEADVIAKLRDDGYDAATANQLIQIAGEPVAPGQALDLLNRYETGAIRGGGTFDTNWVRQVLSESRLKNKYQDAILELRYQLLTASDYIRLAVRDVFVPAKRAELTLDAEFPELLVGKMRGIGVSESDARDLWAAHWDLPSPTQVYEMLHRKIIGPKDVATYLASADYAPTWRQKLIDISYNPITRTDAKRAYKIKAPGFDDARLTQAFTDLGYSQSDAELLMGFTRQDVGEEARQERELLVGPVRSAALAMYKARRISETELRSTLANLRYPIELVDRFIADVQFARDAEQRDDVAAALKGAYVKALRSLDDTRAMLLAHGWDGSSADDLLEVWTILRETTELQPHQEANRDLTKQEITGAFADDLYDETQFRDAILHLGYDATETDVIVGRATLVKTRKALADNVAVIHEEVIGGTRSFDDASVALDKLGVPATTKRLYLIRWGQERLKRIPDFPVALLEKLANAKLLGDTDARFYLINQGYDERQIQLLLSLWGITAREKAVKAAEKKGGTGGTMLSRRDWEALYYTDKTKRSEVLAGLKAIGYSDASAILIIDGIDRNRLVGK
jgi:hypothetical protein